MNLRRKTPQLAPLALIFSLSVLPLACGGGGGSGPGVITDDPSIQLTLTPNPTTVPQPGGAVTYTIQIVNTSSSTDPVTIDALSDSIFGIVTQIAGMTCTLPQTIQPGGSYSCTFPAVINGNQGDSRTNTVTATGRDDDGTAVSGSASTTVAVTGPGGLQATFDGLPAGAGASLSMADFNSADATFEVQIMVSGISDFFGAAFRVSFDSTTARFDDFDATNSVVESGGASTEISAVLAPGKTNELIVTATRLQGGGGTYVPSVDATNSSLLITLEFTAVGSTVGTSGNTFSFLPAPQREVETCNNGTETCDMVADATLSWTGGTMTAN